MSALLRLPLFVLALLNFAFDSFCCIGFSAFSSLSASPYYSSFCCGPNLATSNLVAKGVPNVPFSPIKNIGQKMAQKCRNAAFSPYRTNELRRIVSLYQLNEGQSGAKLSCSFDPLENCAWQNAKRTQLAGESEDFVRARFESAEFNWDKFECTGQRAIPLDGFFLLAGGRTDAATEAVTAIEAKVPCQTEKAMLKFDYWSINETPILKICVVPEKTVYAPQCEESKMDINPLTFEIPKNGGPFRLRIEVDNIVGRDDFVLIDNIQYDGNGDNICSNELKKLVTKNAVDGLLISKKEQLEDADEFMRGESNDGGGGTDGTKGEYDGFYHNEKAKRKMPIPSAQNGNEFGQHSGDVRFSSVFRRRKNESDQFVFGPEFAYLCEALKCNFNDGKECRYNLSAIGGIRSKWQIVNGPMGNAHMGIHKNSRGGANLGGYAFVGSDYLAKKSENKLFVFGSPKLRVEEPVTLLFDLFQRSVGPQLKVCLNTLWNNCSYTNPTKPDKEKHWQIGQKVILPRGTERVFFVGSKLRRNNFIAIDNIRLQRTLKFSRKEIC